MLGGNLSLYQLQEAEKKGITRSWFRSQRPGLDFSGVSLPFYQLEIQYEYRIKDRYQHQLYDCRKGEPADLCVTERLPERGPRGSRAGRARESSLRRLSVRA